MSTKEPHIEMRPVKCPWCGCQGYRKFECIDCGRTDYCCDGMLQTGDNERWGAVCPPCTDARAALAKAVRA